MRCHKTASSAVRHTLRVAVPAVYLATFVALLALAGPASAQTLGRDVATTAVVQLSDRSGRQSRLLEASATDAVALALSDSKEFLVTPTADVEREMKALALSPPLTTGQAVRLGRRLDVTCVTLGEVLGARVDQQSGQASIRLQIMVVDVDAEEPLDGAAVSAETRPKPGWRGTEADLLNEALRDAAERAVSTMFATRIPKGTIEAVVASGNCEINLGAQDGVKPGMKMVVLRPMYIRDLEKVVMRKIGRVEIAEALADICYASPQAMVAPRTGDTVLRVYEPAAKVEAATAKKQGKGFIAVAAGVALLGALVSIASGGNISSAGPTPVSYVSQSAMGAQPSIRIRYPKPDRAWGHLMFRGEFAGFPADAPYLVHVSAAPSGEEELSFLDDEPGFVDEQDRTITVSFVDESGEWATETVDCTWTHPALIPGETYFHRMRKVTRPNLPPGSNPPIATIRERPSQNPDNTIDQSSDFPMISEPSKVMGPVTYIEPSPLYQPAAEGIPQNPTGPIDFEWGQALGADEYMLEIFPASDPGGLGQPAIRHSGIRPEGSGSVFRTLRPTPGELQGNSTYFWRVGGRNSLEATDKPPGQGIPRVGLGDNEIRGWVLSEMRSFDTASTPPPNPRIVKPGKTKTVDIGSQPGRPGRGARPAKPSAGKPKRTADAQPVAPPRKGGR